MAEVDLLIFLIAWGLAFCLANRLSSYFDSCSPAKRDALAEAKMRLEQARHDAAAAVLDKETNQIYDHLYHEALQDDPQDEQNRSKK